MSDDTNWRDRIKRLIDLTIEEAEHAVRDPNNLVAPATRDEGRRSLFAWIDSIDISDRETGAPSMSELDEAAVEAAVRAGYAAWMLSPWVGMESPEPFDDTAEGYQASWRCEIRAAITAYLAAAARPTPDAEAMEREFVGAIKDLAVKAHRVGVYPSSFALREEDVAIKHVMSQYRKAVSR